MSTKQQRQQLTLLVAAIDLRSGLGSGTWNIIHNEVKKLSDELLRRSRLTEAWEQAGFPQEYDVLAALAGIDIEEQK